MKLIVKCPSCKQEIKTPHHVDNRIDYAKQYGDNFSLKCTNCNETTEYHVDDIKAIDYTVGEILKNRIFLFVVVFLVSSVLGFIFIGLAGVIMLNIIITLVIIALIKKNNSAANLTFNKHKLKARVSGIGFKK